MMPEQNPVSATPNTYQRHTSVRVVNIDRLVRFLFLIADIDDLQNVVVGVNLQCAHVDLHIVLQEILRQSPHFLRPSGAPHQSLAIRLHTGKTTTTTPI